MSSRIHAGIVVFCLVGIVVFGVGYQFLPRGVLANPGAHGYEFAYLRTHWNWESVAVTLEGVCRNKDTRIVLKHLGVNMPLTERLDESHLALLCAYLQNEGWEIISHNESILAVVGESSHALLAFSCILRRPKEHL